MYTLRWFTPSWDSHFWDASWSPRWHLWGSEISSKPNLIHGHILRGVSWRTKTSVSGQPRGVCCLGVPTRPSMKHWVFRFLEIPSWTDSIPVRITMALLWFGTMPSATGYDHQYYDRNRFFVCQLIVWNQHSLLQQVSSISTLSKDGHHKQSVQLYSIDDVWPSLFLQRDILINISAGWRPLTSQARGAKQPLPEPDFVSPPITEAGLQLLQMLAPAIKDANKEPSAAAENDFQPITSTDDDQLSSSSSDSDSSSSSEDEALPNAGGKSILVILTNHTWCMWHPRQIRALPKEHVLLSKTQPLRLIVVPPWREYLLKLRRLSHQVLVFANARQVKP